MALEYRSASDGSGSQKESPTVIIALIVATIVLLYIGIGDFVVPSGRVGQAKIAAAKQDVSSLRVSLDALKQNNGRYPTTPEGLGALVVNPMNATHAEYIEKVPMDPWGNPYIYNTPDEGATCVLYSTGPDATPGTADDVK